MSKRMEMLESCQQSTDSHTVLVEDRMNNFLEGEVHYRRGDYWKKMLIALDAFHTITWKSPNHLGISKGVYILPSNLVNIHLLSTPV